MTDETAVREVVAAISAAWRESRLDDLADLLHPEVVFVAPGFADRLEGREACVDSYRAFLSGSTILEYEEGDPAIHVVADTAVSTARYRIAWEAGGVTDRETGHEVLVLARDAAGWRVVWRTLAPGTV